MAGSPALMVSNVSGFPFDADVLPDTVDDVRRGDGRARGHAAGQREGRGHGGHGEGAELSPGQTAVVPWSAVVSWVWPLTGQCMRSLVTEVYRHGHSPVGCDDRPHFFAASRRFCCLAKASATWSARGLTLEMFMLAAAATAMPSSGNVSSETDSAPRASPVADHPCRRARELGAADRPAERVSRGRSRGEVRGRLERRDGLRLQQPGLQQHRAEPHQVRRRGEKRSCARQAGILRRPVFFDAKPGPQDRSRRIGARIVKARTFRKNGAVHAERLEHLALHEAREGLAAGLLDHRAHQHPAVDRVAMLGPRLEPELVIGEERDRLVEVRAGLGGHAVAVAVVAAAAVDARDVAHQLARGDRPWLLRIRGHVALHRRIEIEASPIVQQGGRHRRHRLRERAQTKARERRHRRAVQGGIAEALCPHDGAVHGHSHRQARQILFHQERAREAPCLVHRGHIATGADVSRC